MVLKPQYDDVDWSNLPLAVIANVFTEVNLRRHNKYSYIKCWLNIALINNASKFVISAYI